MLERDRVLLAIDKQVGPDPSYQRYMADVRLIDLSAAIEFTKKGIEPPRDCRRPFGLSYAAMGASSSMA